MRSREHTSAACSQSRQFGSERVVSLARHPTARRYTLPSAFWGDVHVWRLLARVIGIVALACAPLIALPYPSARAADALGKWAPIATAGAPSARYAHSAVWTGTEMIVWGGLGYQGPATNPTASFGAFDDGAVYDPRSDTWTPLPRQGAPSARWGHAAAWTGSEMLIWGGRRSGGDQTLLSDGARYNPETRQWRPMSAVGAPSPRYGEAAVWIGNALLIWGGAGEDGALGDGARYDPDHDTWSPLPSQGAPSPSAAPAAVWTGKDVIVWGGACLDQVATAGPGCIDGSRYDPATNTWRPMSTINAPSPLATVAVWTGSELVVWGGPRGSGARYNPSIDTWTPMSLTNAPYARSVPSALWTGNEVLIWGGCCHTPPAGRGGFSNDGGLYDPKTDTWTPISAEGAPVPRAEYGAVWTGHELILWGGTCCGPKGEEPADLTYGARYDVAARHWTPLPQEGAPTPRFGPPTVLWTGREMLVWGGSGRTGSLSDGATYRPPDPQK